jgi:hypothetical protein
MREKQYGVTPNEQVVFHLTTTPKRGGIKGDPKRVKFSPTV